MPDRNCINHNERPAVGQCFQCHKPEEVRTDNHPDVTRVDCLICHTGHHSSRPSLLKPDIPIPTRPSESGGEL